VISGLANDENTIPGQLAGSGDETVPEREQSGSGEKIVPDDEQVSGSGEETNDVVVDKATETIEEKTTGLGGPTR
jgi:hypothetical protein